MQFVVVLELQLALPFDRGFELPHLGILRISMSPELGLLFARMVRTRSVIGHAGLNCHAEDADDSARAKGVNDRIVGL